MSNYDYDLFIIGAGSGGVRAARMAAAQGVRVAVAEYSRPGGTCVNLGCVPKKLFSYAADYHAFIAQAERFGWNLAVDSFSWDILHDNTSAVLERNSNFIGNMVEQAGAEIIHGHARLSGPHSVTVGDKAYSAERILLAPGGTPQYPDIPGNEYLKSSNDMFSLPCLPRQMLIVGGGYIACEFASILNALGVKVIQIYRKELFLRGFDRDVREFVAEEMRRLGVDLRFNCDLTAVSHTAEGYQASLNDGTSITTDLILAATGRRPNIAGLGLEEHGIELTASGAVKVDNYFQTSIPSVYALGDVIDRVQLTPVALAEAMTLVRNLYQGTTDSMDYRLIPSAVFSHPNIAAVGLSEEDAIRQFAQVDVYLSKFTPLKHALSRSGDKYLMKLVVDHQTDRVVGAHMVGEHAGETIQGLAIALKAGATKKIFDQTIGIHPTSAEEFVTMRSVTRRHGVKAD